jgi:predicted protein tyrosine phosphatase
MNIIITGHQRAAIRLREQPGQYDFLFITSPRMPFEWLGSEQVLEHARSSLMLQFDDIDSPMSDLTEPQRHHVESALSWAPDKSNLLIACQAGISRSSATAVVVRASRMSVPEALEILDPGVHHPNQLIIQLGEAILDKPGLADAVSEWKRFRRQQSW